MKLIKAHAYGNDFLLAATAPVSAGAGELPAVARQLCDRHRGIGGDGLLLYDETPDGARARLLNADGSPSEVSGNGVRCLAGWIALQRGLAAGARVEIDTDAGRKSLTLLERHGHRLRFRASMGQPTELREETIDVAGTPVAAVVLRVGNPQCVVLGHATEERLRALASQLAVHPFFPEGTNVELADVEGPHRVRILIWERGVGPTLASGTGACAAAVAAAAYGGASREVDVIAPGGTQHVEWTPDTIWLTGDTDIVAEVNWLRG
jgi:diaminopimelate epimerase